MKANRNMFTNSKFKNILILPYNYYVSVILIEKIANNYF